MKCQSSNKNTIRVRQSATVQEGLCITIPCGFTANYKSTFRNATGLWITNKNVTVASSNPSYTRRKPNFLITGNPNNGNCTLTITGAKKEDSGSYFFRFKEPSASQVDYNSSVSVQVTDLKEKPKIWMPDELIAGKEVKLGCVPPGNCPGKPRVQWKKSNVVGTWMKLAGFSFTPTQNDHQKSVTCEVITLTGKIITAQHILSISYPPANMKITISSSTGRNIDLNGTIVISEKEFLILNCSVEANPPARVFWNKSNHIKQDNTIAEGMIWSAINITEPNIYRCFASNKYGINETFMDIKAEKGSSLDDSLILNRGESVTLNCIVNSYILSTAIWLREDAVFEYSHTKRLFLNVTSPGTYRCLAWNQFGAMARSIRIYPAGYSFGKTNKSVSRFMSYSVIAWIVSGNVIFVLLVALGLYCFIKRQKEKKPTRSGSHVYELDDQNKAESVYQDLSGQRNSIYHTIK